ncbi:MAG: AI-2E family transporter [Candidatus Manganitrophus sp. SB1]|nr:AI-2E family transporter [Candidatus Manganitrophus morganii]
MGRISLAIKTAEIKKKAEPVSSRSTPKPPVFARVGPLGAFPLNLISALVVIFTLQWAREVLIPLVIALFISYFLDPIVARMEKRKISRAVGTAFLLTAIVAGIGSAIYGLGDQADAILEQLPAASQKFRQSLREGRNDREGTLNKVQKAATEIEKAAAEAANAAAPQVKPAQAARPGLDLRNYLWVGTIGLVGMALQAVMILFLVYFLLVSGDTFRRRLVKIAGPSFSRKRRTLEILDEINLQMKRFLYVQVITSLWMGVAIWLAFRWIGLENAGMWGIAAGILKSIPFLGGTAIIGGTALVGYLQFETLSMALLIGGVSMGLKSLEGLLVSPLMTSKAGRIHTVWIFVGIFFWGWIWGVWGLLLGIPIIMVAKAVCDRIEGLQPIGELLGDERRAHSSGGERNVTP